MYGHHIRRALTDAVQHRRLSDGTPLVVRPITPADKGALASFFAALTPESRNRRFLGAKPSLSSRELAYFTEIDHRRHVALVAQDHAGRLVGLGQYAGWAGDPRAGELAIAIADEYQRQGLGTTLAYDLIERARANELDRLTATTQSRNLAAHRLLHRVGFQVTNRADGLIELELAL